MLNFLRFTFVEVPKNFLNSCFFVLKIKLNVKQTIYYFLFMFLGGEWILVYAMLQEIFTYLLT